MRRFQLAPLFLALMAAGAQAAPIELLSNGNFETGTLAGWTATSRSGSAGDIAIDAPGSNTPNGNQVTAPNPLGGSFYAVTSQNGPGSYSLMQQFSVAPGAASVVLSFQMFANNHNPSTIVGADLDHTGAPNQHARVDLLDGSAGAFDLGAAVLQNFYIGADAGTNPNPYTSYSIDITSLVAAGGTFSLRFAQVDNQFYFNLGVDNVSILADVGTVPAPSALALSVLALGLAGVARRRRG